MEHIAEIGRLAAIDIEADPSTGRIFAAAAVDASGADPVRLSGPNVNARLRDLDVVCARADLVVGHNIVDFDLPRLAEAEPGLQLLAKPAIDTLRLNPLAFPANPYHRLVKHYREGQLASVARNDPESDARLALELLGDQVAALGRLHRTSPDLVAVYHHLVAGTDHGAGFDRVFRAVRRAPAPAADEASAALSRVLGEDICCSTAAGRLGPSGRRGWPLAYALSFLSVAGGDSALSPWVRGRFPEAAEIVCDLRARDCGAPGCRWCREHNDPARLLHRWFGFEAFRPEPKSAEGRPLQEEIVARALAGRSTLGILPTGTGKSICYQIPALAAYETTGALTVAISPLVALMSDQVEGLARQGIGNAVAVNGTLSLPERHEALERVRLGEAAILIIAPEQLRNRTVRSVIAQREIGLWVMDEAHCLSKWGHDFRPDYRYVGRFMREFAGGGPLPPVLCLTATAKPGVVADIRAYFRDKAGVDLGLVDGGATRTNLAFEVVETTEGSKLQTVLATVEDRLPPEDRSGAIVYCATRAETERVAGFLAQHGVPADHFHAGLTPERKREVQERFRTGELRVVAATNAFGMGIDKPDVRLVVHADIPGSLEAYLQEAGRAGRDRLPAACVLLFDRRAVDRQFSMVSRGRVAHRDVSGTLKSLRRLDRRMKRNGEVVVTAGEIARADEDRPPTRDEERETATRIAVAWLEEADLLLRDENRVALFPSCLRIRRIEDADRLLEQVGHLSQRLHHALRSLALALLQAPADRGISTDDLSGIARVEPRELRGVLKLLERIGIASNDTALTALVHVGVEHSSQRRLQRAAAMEADLVALLRETAPDLAPGERAPINLRVASQALSDRGHRTANPNVLEKLLRGLARDRREAGAGSGSLAVRRTRGDERSVTLHVPWDVLAATAEARRAGAAVMLAHLESRVPPGRRGADLQAETTLGAVDEAWSTDLHLRSLEEGAATTPERALLWMHEQEVITLGRGLMIFRPAMTIRLVPGSRQFTKADCRPLDIHYAEKNRQVHVMARYAEAALRAPHEAARLVADYFALEETAFLSRWLADVGNLVERPTTVETWRQVVQGLGGNPVQRRIVTDEGETVSTLVLAGPGSGKTRVLVHRVAYLLKVLRQDPRGILVLTYNRHAAAEIRTRLAALIGEEAYGPTISTCHGLAMRLVGASFAGRRDPVRPEDFSAILQRAVDLLHGRGLPPEEAEASREDLVRDYSWILVDEYQDIGPGEYDLISAMAGRSLGEEGRLGLFAVGDDDQNIYAFRGASVEFIRRFETDYAARPVHLLENYRSTGHIIAAAERVIVPAAERMKAGHRIEPDRARRNDHPGGILGQRDAVGGGRVQVLPAGSDMRSEAVRAIDELQRLAALGIPFDWSRTAVIAREWSHLDPVRSVCEHRGIPVQLGNEDMPSFWRLRETQALVDRIRALPGPTVSLPALRDWLARQDGGPWTQAIVEGLDSYAREIRGNDAIPHDLLDALADWGRSVRRRQSGLLLTTAHGSKGLEFDDVVILDGSWDARSWTEDRDASRRLYYVAMTRARRSLALMRFGPGHPFLRNAGDDSCFLLRQDPGRETDVGEAGRLYRRLNLSEVDLGYAGRLPPDAPALAAIERIRTGDPVSLRSYGSGYLVTNSDGMPVGRLARKWNMPAGHSLLTGRVAHIVTRWADDETEPFRPSLQRDRWEVVVPEFVFEPGTTAKAAKENGVASQQSRPVRNSSK